MKSTTPQPNACDLEATSTVPKLPADQTQRPKYLNNLEDKDVEKLKQHIRVLKNLSPKEERRRKLVPFANPPSIAPKSNTATLLRTKLQDRWIELNIKSLMKKYSCTEDDIDSKTYWALRKEALSRPSYEFCDEKERQSFEDLKQFSKYARRSEEPEFKLNRNFDFRLRTSKGIPIITETFTKHYDDYEKAPFINPKTCAIPKFCRKPSIDENEELFLYPLDEDDPIPLHRIKKVQPEDSRTLKEKARPPLKAVPKRTPLAERRSVKPLPTKKPAWHYAFQCKEFNMVYAPTIFERYSVTYQVTNYRVHCTIWDTSGTPGYDTVRPLAYPETHVFILCFTISDPTTLENIVTKWYPEVRRYCQTTPLILCGCQSDLRNDCETLSKLAEIQRIPVSAEQGVAVSRQIGATTYVETSSKTCPKAIQDAFEVSALAALGKLNKSLSSNQKFASHRYNGTWHRAKVDLNFRDRSKNCVVM